MKLTVNAALRLDEFLGCNRSDYAIFGTALADQVSRLTCSARVRWHRMLASAPIVSSATLDWP